MAKIPNRTFGVELEVAGIGQEGAYMVLRMAGVNVEDPYAWRDTEDTSKWRFHDDGSIEDRRSSGGRTCEVVSPILTGVDGLRQVRKVCAALKAAGAYVNDSCGLHVHVGARDLTPKEVFMICKRYAEHEAFLDSVMHPSRRANENEFCGSMKDTMEQLDPSRRRERIQAEIDNYQQAIAILPSRCPTCRTREAGSGSDPNCFRCNNNRRRHMLTIEAYERQLATIDNGWPSVSSMVEAAYERYRNVNLTAFSRHGTLEFRQHNGALDPKVVSNWIRFVLNFVERSRALSGEKRVKVKDPETRSRARKAVYGALKEAGHAGLSKARILALTNGAWTMVRPNIERMRREHNLTIEEFRQNGELHWRMIMPVPGPNPLYKDRGPLMGLPKYVKSYFVGRTMIDTDNFDAWA